MEELEMTPIFEDKIRERLLGYGHVLHHRPGNAHIRRKALIHVEGHKGNRGRPRRL